jgi:hypothetical protein
VRHGLQEADMKMTSQFPVRPFDQLLTWLRARPGKWEHSLNQDREVEPVPFAEIVAASSFLDFGGLPVEPPVRRFQ